MVLGARCSTTLCINCVLLLPCAACRPAGVPQHQVSELSKSLPSLGTTIHAGGSSSAAAESLVRDLAMLLSIDSAPSSTRALGGAAAAQRLQVIAHDLPKVLCGPLLELISSHQQHGGVRDAAGARQQQQQLRAFVAALEAELPRMAATAAARVGSPSSSAWAAASSAVGVPADAAEGLLELLGEQDAAELLAKAAAKPGSPDAVEQQQGLYDMLADIHHDVDIQRYLQVSVARCMQAGTMAAPHGCRLACALQPKVCSFCPCLLIGQWGRNAGVAFTARTRQCVILVRWWLVGLTAST